MTGTGQCLRHFVGQPQQVELTGMRVEVLPPHLQVAHGGEDGGVAHQHLDGGQIHPRFQQVSGKAVASVWIPMPFSMPALCLAA